MQPLQIAGTRPSISAPASASRARVAVRTTAVGDNPFAATAEHRIFLHRGEATQAWCQCDGLGFSADLHEPGDIDIVPVGDSGVWTAARPTELMAVALCPSAISDAAERAGVRMSDIDIRPRFKARSPRIGALVQALDASGEASLGLDGLFADSLAIALATQLLGLSELEVSSPKALGRRRLRLVRDYIETHLDAPLQLAELADVVGLSRAHFASGFRDATGLSPHQYVLRRRVSHARDLLVGSRTPISEIALQTGFAHQSHLARTMKKILGVTPGRLVASLPCADR